MTIWPYDTMQRKEVHDTVQRKEVHDTAQQKVYDTLQQKVYVTLQQNEVYVQQKEVRDTSAAWRYFLHVLPVNTQY